MSKVDIRLNYKNACILKHLAMKEINRKAEMYNKIKHSELTSDKLFIKKYEEEVKAYNILVNQINEWKEAHGIKDKQKEKGDV